MVLTEESNLVMPVSPMGNGGGFGGFGGDNGGWWLILLFLVFGLGGWGNNGNNSNGGAGGLYPWMNQSQQINDGFRDQMLNTSINGIAAGVQGIQTQLCNSFANAEIADNARQIANMQQGFNMQTAITGGMTDIASQFANCCCENRLATCQTQNIIQNEANATRFADVNNTRDIIQSQSQGTKAILDKLCQLELDAKDNKISDLERQLTMANLAASQTAQTARLLADNSAQTTALEQYLNPVPIPAYVVQNPNCCSQNYGCGCGM